MSQGNLATAQARKPANPEDLQREKVALVGQMTLGIAHELSNPLAAIVASAQTMLAFWPRKTDKSGDGAGEAPTQLDPAAAIQFREDIELILSEARRAGEIVGGLLAFARQKPNERAVVSVFDIIHRVAALSSNLMRTHNVELHLPTDNETNANIFVEGDPNQLQQVLLNLFVNAQQAISAVHTSGSVEVMIRQPDPGFVEILVDDDGPGIPEDEWDQIFEPFYTTKPDGQGTGLGLSICADIIRKHGGVLRIEKSDRTGTRFVVSLQIVSNLARTEEPSPEGKGSEQEKSVLRIATREARKVLLVDDEAAILRSVGRFLENSGYDVQIANTGSEALEAIRESQFDAVISDLRMPGLSGEELFKHTKAEQPETASRMVFTSGDMLREESREFVRNSGCKSLEKPYELSALLEILEQICHHPNGDETA